MELRQLECFVAVAEELSFTGAAARLHVVQSAVSATIAALEGELHTRLLERTSRRVDLSDAGRALLPKARAALDAVRDARDAVDDVNGGVRGTLRVGTLSSLGSIDLPALLGRFHREHPAVSVRLATAASCGASPGLVKALTEGRLDLAFVSVPGSPPPGVRWRNLTTTPLYLVVPAGHRLAERSRVTLGELADEAFIDFPRGYGNRAVTDRAFATAGLRRNVAIEITAIGAGADFVRHGLGVALLPRGSAGPDGNLVALPITGADLNWPISLATPGNRSASAAARAFERLVDQHLR
ncbi:LysR family transcriptional regulator [Streptantibioticus cattleyicolor]|uniref:LysR family transcriptional regulator n=1 Tax=Streptantibioticus cattleyicolor (strain ATCC 35852 / DSM 46488 / JCM 4925 / NBRC 14057 / NRRL 8057) TaxID=1003195 RepID=F8JLX0_STREN|nr:LysR substrate-binding domain-containing protein [Streptantibioticus cattleyicolor]AEW98221.1 LysR family transcriptional regulator [Streptantibioticus cattleyicolor NRRL 8057 = DSM 46488]CCB72714.1 putative LysR-family transcriptional regulator [Streptantibioticus cattleyicolor NRRL 8057 = DSM 46488]